MIDYSLAQTSVLGSVLIDERVAGDVVTMLQPEDFTEGPKRDIFLAIRDMYMLREKIDPVLVLDRLRPVDRGTATDYLMQLMDATPTAANVQEYIAVVREQSRLTAIKTIALRLATESVVMDDTREYIAQLNGLMVERPGVECLSMEQGVLDFYEEQERKPEYLTWGVDFLDQGLIAESGDYIVLGGYPSDGKTALALSMAYHQAKTKRVGFFSLETKNSKLFNRIFASVAQVSGQRIKRRKLTDEDHMLLANKSDEIRSHNLFLVRSSSMTVADVAAYARAQRFDVIYIDYLTLLRAPGRTEFDQATYISKELHRIAQDTGLTVIALSQLNRGEKGKKAPPTLQSLRSSGQIEQDADIVMFIYREEPWSLRSRRILDVAKNKEGVTGRTALLFDGDTQTFRADINQTILKSALPEKQKYEQMQFSDLQDLDGDVPF